MSSSSVLDRSNVVPVASSMDAISDDLAGIAGLSKTHNKDANGVNSFRDDLAGNAGLGHNNTAASNGTPSVRYGRPYSPTKWQKLADQHIEFGTKETAAAVATMDEAQTNPPPPPPEQEARPKRRLRKQPASKSAPANFLQVAYSCKCDSSVQCSGDPESLPLHSGLPDQSSEDSNHEEAHSNKWELHPSADDTNRQEDRCHAT